MSTEPNVSDELARRDLGDIGTLRNTEAFDRYFMRRLRQDQAKVEAEFKRGKMDKDEREVLRRITLIYEDILDMMKRDEGSIRSQLSARD